jgi:hypothetical protein
MGYLGNIIDQSSDAIGNLIKFVYKPCLNNPLALANSADILEK